MDSSEISPSKIKHADRVLLGGQLTQTADSRADSGAVGRAQRVGTTGNGLAAGIAAPDADGLSAEGELTAEGAEVLGVLRDLELLGALTGVGTIAGTIAAHDAHLDGTLSHFVLEFDFHNILGIFKKGYRSFASHTQSILQDDCICVSILQILFGHR